MGGTASPGERAGAAPPGTAAGHQPGAGADLLGRPAVCALRAHQLRASRPPPAGDRPGHRGPTGHGFSDSRSAERSNDKITIKTIAETACGCGA